LRFFVQTLQFELKPELVIFELWNSDSAITGAVFLNKPQVAHFLVLVASIYRGREIFSRTNFSGNISVGFGG
jgi:hypothetical protein